MANKAARVSKCELTRAAMVAKECGVIVEIDLKEARVRFVPGEIPKENNKKEDKVALCEGIAL
jgi:hypothetical protein